MVFALLTVLVATPYSLLVTALASASIALLSPVMGSLFALKALANGTISAVWHLWHVLADNWKD